ncbi:MAG: hypothetical protein JNJ47_07260, partial [Alphaproteobacteria bacterium]|nr:hypothetical protein [Alphaproteobacteria bacterium]
MKLVIFSFLLSALSLQTGFGESTPQSTTNKDLETLQGLKKLISAESENGLRETSNDQAMSQLKLMLTTETLKSATKELKSQKSAVRLLQLLIDKVVSDPRL